MIVEVIYVLLFIPFLWLSPWVSKKMYAAALKRNWKNPDDYKTIGNMLFIIPAQGVCRLLTDHTPDSFFLHGLSNHDSWVNWVLSIILFVVVFVIMMLSLRYIQKLFNFSYSSAPPKL